MPYLLLDSPVDKIKHEVRKHSRHFWLSTRANQTIVRQTLTGRDTNGDEEAPMTIGKIGDQHLESDVGIRELKRQRRHEVRRNPNPKKISLGSPHMRSEGSNDGSAPELRVFTRRKRLKRQKFKKYILK
ncbi:hypothetical protein ACE6H2_001971 [Prunus campanulata]